MTTMQRTAAAAGSAVFFVLAPGTIVGLVPWLITDWHPGAPLSHLLPLRVLGAVLVVAGTATLVSAFARFVVEGLATPAPVAPPAHLVVGGLYRHVRNPIYLALDATILGQAIVLWRPDLLWYTGFVALALVAWVYGLEQPELQNRFGARYDEYRRAVPGWWPRLRPWQPR
jgi:protein-S-isoprenylcysteine O-methyltransferase Ste14